MKLATYKDGSRDGQLVVVSRDLTSAHYASGIASRLQQVMDDWNFISPQLQDLYQTLNQGKVRHAFPFDPAMCMAPLPRAYQWADGSAYMNHVELVRASRNSEVPANFYEDPLMYHPHRRTAQADLRNREVCHQVQDARSRRSASLVRHG